MQLSEMAKNNWIVRIKCTITKDVYCYDCSKEQAEKEPFEFASDEVEIDQVDWEVQSVKEND